MAPKLTLVVWIFCVAICRYLASLLDEEGQLAVDKYAIGVISKQEASVAVDASLRRKKEQRRKKDKERGRR